MATDNKTAKSFWQRPEGKPGMVLLAGLICLGGFILYKSLPTIIELMQNLYTAIALGAGLFVIASILMNDKFRSTVWYLYKGLMRWFTGMAIELNPIAILESYVEDIKKKLVKMEAQLQDLKGQIGIINKKLEIKKEELEHNVGLGRQAQKVAGREAEVQMYAVQVTRLQKYIDKLQALSTKMGILFKVLDKMKYYSSIMIKNTEMEVEMRKEEREAITKSHSVMKSAMNIIAGNDDKKVIFDQAMEFVIDDIGFKVGEMDRMLETSNSFINSVDLENGIYEEQGMKILEEFDRKGLETIFGTANKNALNAGSTYNNLNVFGEQPTVLSATEKKTDTNADSKKKYFK